MKHAARNFGMVAVTLAMFASTAQAQDGTRITVGPGVGATFPIGNVAESLDWGWNAQANLGLTNPSWPVGLRFDFVYNAISGETLADGEDNDLRMLAGLANIQLKLNRDSDGGFFILGGPGYYNLEQEQSIVADKSDSEFGLFGGLGYKLAMTNLLLSVEGKYHHIFTEGESSKFIPISIVAEIPIGGGGVSARR